MRQLDRRVQILLGVLGAIIVAFLLWKVVLSGGGGSSTVEQPTTVTTLATGQTGTGTGAGTGTVNGGSATGNGTSPTTAYVEVPFDPSAARDPFTPAG
jgi:hypothetical protein